jgi:hypothetical protein
VCARARVPTDAHAQRSTRSLAQQEAIPPCRSRRPRALGPGVHAGRQPGADVRPARLGAGPGRPRPGDAEGAAGRGYLLLGRDLIPDEIPIIGGIDDLIVVVVAVEVFLDGVEDRLLAEKLDQLGIDRVAFERDIDRVRRVVPRPIRRAVHELPRAVDAAAELAAQSGLGARLRAAISKEGTLA